MLKCSKCSKEYDEVHADCPECSKKEGKKEDIKWVMVATASNAIEYNMIAGVLQMGNIPVVRRVNGVDGIAEIFLGVPIAGIDVLVPEDKYDEAYELLNAGIVSDEMEEDT